MKINVRGQRKEDHYHIEFEDNGLGIPSSQLGDLFTFFHKLHKQGEHGDIGFGLTLCNKIVQRHHGTIKAESEENKGTKILITLPISQKNLIF